MTKARKTSRLFGLLALLAGLMAFSAIAAQAEPGAYWEVGGTKILNSGELLTEINARINTAHGILLTKSGLAVLEIDCTEISLDKGLLHQLGRATGRINFTSCITRLNGSEASKCRPHSPGAAEGTILTNSLEGLLKLHHPTLGDPEDVLELKPEAAAGGVFVTIELGSGKCAIKGANITGVGFVKDVFNEHILINEIEHSFVEFKFLSKLLYGGNSATTDGSARTFLEGAHLNQEWSGHPA